MGAQNRRLSPVWTINDSFENRRLALQAELDANKTTDERRKLGQFATPTLLAREVVSFGINNMDTPHDIRFFDPACGTGAFYSALLAEADSNDITMATAVEIDPLLASVAYNFWYESNISVINADFTEIEPDGFYNI